MHKVVGLMLIAYASTMTASQQELLPSLMLSKEPSLAEVLKDLSKAEAHALKELSKEVHAARAFIIAIKPSSEKASLPKEPKVAPKPENIIPYIQKNISFEHFRRRVFQRMMSLDAAKCASQALGANDVNTILYYVEQEFPRSQWEEEYSNSSFNLAKLNIAFSQLPRGFRATSKRQAVQEEIFEAQKRYNLSQKICHELDTIYDHASELDPKRSPDSPKF